MAKGGKSMNFYIYVDDIRTDMRWFYRTFNCTFDDKEWTLVICRNYNEAIKALDQLNGANVVLDLDHDLGFDPETGEDLNGYRICLYVLEHQIPLMGFHLHSMNPVGVANMRQVLTKAGYKFLY